MPELPEVEAARRAIEESCIGKKIVKAVIADDTKVIDGVSRDEFEKSLTGKKVVGVFRKGKNMWIQLDSPPFPSFQFGMAGAIYIKGVAVTKYKRSAVSDTDEWPSKYSKLFIELDDGLELSFTDKRRFAKVRLLKNPASAPPISELGPDALLEPMTEDELYKALSKKKIGIKALLLDQSFISGVGNWIADEVLYQGKRLVFVTNNSTKSRKQYGKKFETLGLSVNEEEIFASSFAAAAYLQSIDFPKDKKIYVIGEEGILIELELAGFSYLGGPEDGGKKIELKPGFYMEHDENVGAVVVGFDRYFNYYKVQYGTLCIRENPGCLFLATNRDAVTHLTDAQEWAGGGSMVGALVGSTQREPLTVGKPSTFMMDYLANKFGITKSQICMVGDRLDTDILFGQNGGCKTLLVLSGVTSLSMLQNPNNSIQPDFYTTRYPIFCLSKLPPCNKFVAHFSWLHACICIAYEYNSS